MKRFSICLMVLLVACSKPPAVAPATRQTLWIDEATHSDTIITNFNNQPPLIYYAKKNWQTSADTSITHGYRFIAIRFNDRILVKRVNDFSTNYHGPFLLHANERYDTLKAQNFLDTINVVNTIPVNIYILLH